jgi:3-hydroxybutyryl-CoA dehydratase
MQVGDTTAWERTFTLEDVTLFGQLSGDQGIHHITPDKHGRVMVQGLLTATLPTKLGGDMNYIASALTFEFIRPVYVGDTVRCEITITLYEPGERYDRMESTYVCRNQRGEEVLKGRSSGIIREPRP